jgi:DNA-directed RNA polymerase specialized sigma24 family protein
LVLQLFYLEERSVKEIRAETGWSLSNVKTLLHRARKRFRSLMPSAEVPSSVKHHNHA